MIEPDLEIAVLRHAAGIDNPVERASLTERLARDADLRACLEEWGAVLAPLSAPQPDLPPDPDVWRAISERLGFDRTEVRVQKAADSRWVPVSQGIEIRYMHVDPVEGERTILLRMGGGAILPQHLHDRDEECVVLAGEVRLGGVKYLVGDYLIAPAKTRHEEITTDDGATLLLRWGRKAA